MRGLIKAKPIDHGAIPHCKWIASLRATGSTRRNVGSTLAHHSAIKASEMRATSVILVTLHGLITTDPLSKSDRSDAWIQ
jgi:hypothetical protein